MTAREQIVFDAIVRAARAGEACPDNGTLANLLGAQSVSTGPSVLTSLERAGHVTVARFSCGRDVAIPSLGLATRPHIGDRKPHWRNRGHDQAAQADRLASPKKGRSVSLEQAPVLDADLPPRVDRDPCPRCGVRRDFGCAHSRAPISMGAFA